MDGGDLREVAPHVTLRERTLTHQAPLGLTGDYQNILKNLFQQQGARQENPPCGAGATPKIA